MKVGIFGGGFKPFTTGHFSVLTVALQQNDIVVVYYGLASRKKSSDYDFTKETADEIFSIVKTAIEREFRGKVFVEPGLPNPLVKTFEIIESVKDGSPNKTLASIGLSAQDVEVLTVYADPDDIGRYTTYLGTPKEQKYYGDMHKTGRLRFDPVVTVDPEGKRSVERQVSAMRSHYPNASDADIADLVSVRGSGVRSSVASRDFEKIARFLPAFLNDAEKRQVVAILIRNLNEHNSSLRNLLREYIIGEIRR